MLPEGGKYVSGRRGICSRETDNPPPDVDSAFGLCYCEFLRAALYLSCLQITHSRKEDSSHG